MYVWLLLERNSCGATLNKRLACLRRCWLI